MHNLNHQIFHSLEKIDSRIHIFERQVTHKCFKVHTLDDEQSAFEQ